MKIRYIVLLLVILFIVGCAQQITPTTPTTPATPTPTTPTPPVPTTPTTPSVETKDVMIKDRVVTPTELTIKVGTEILISVEGTTPHLIVVDKETSTVANLGTVTAGKTASYKFETAGKYTIRSLKVASVRVAVTVE